MNKQLVRQALEEYATRHMPPHPDLWPVIRRQARSTAPSPISAWWRVSVPSVLLLALVGLALWTGLLPGGVGVPSGVSTPGSGPAGGPQPSPTALVKTVNGYTVKMQPLWADANRITLRYAVLNAQGNDVGFVRVLPVDPNTSGPAPRLRDNQGTEFPWLVTRSRRDFNTEDPRTPQTDKAVVQWIFVDFNAAGLSDSPAQLNLHLTLAPLILSATPPTEAKVLPTLISVTFDFRMPFDGALLVAALGQTVTVAGVGMMLERVVVSRYEARAVLRVLPPAQGTIHTATLAGTNWSSRNPPTPTRSPTTVECFQLPEGKQACSFYMALLDQQGEWTLSVQGASGTPNERTMGTWMFRFTVPPAVP